MKKLRENKIYKIITTAIKAVFTVCIVTFLGMVCLQRFSDNKFSFLNYRMFTVVTGSMKPVYDIGDVLIAKETDPAKIKKGDVISYLGSRGSFAGKVITHEVVGIEKDKNNKYIFHAKGKTNLIEDPLVTEEQLYGVVIHKSKFLSFIYGIVGTSYGLTLFVVLPMLYIIGSEVLSSMLAGEEKRRNKLKNKD